MNGVVHFAPSQDSVGGSGLHVTGVVGEAYRLLWVRRRAVLNAIILPAVLLSVILCATLQSYYTLLGGFLDAPNPRRAGIVFAILIAGALAWLFVAMLLASAGAAVARHEVESTRWWGVTLGIAQARLFSAALRFAFILFSVACVAAALMAQAEVMAAPAWVAELIATAAIIAFAMLSVRVGFLLPALAERERHAVLRRSFRLTRGNFWRLAVVWTALIAVPAVLLFGMGELALGGWLSPDHLPSLTSAARAASALARDFAGIPAALMLSVITTSCLTLAGIGSQVAYRQLTEQNY